MICPKCGSQAVYIKETAKGTNNEVYRRRHCSDCETKFRTVETIIEARDEKSNNLYSKAIRNRSALLRAYYAERE